MPFFQYYQCFFTYSSPVLRDGRPAASWFRMAFDEILYLPNRNIHRFTSLSDAKQFAQGCLLDIIAQAGHAGGDNNKVFRCEVEGLHKGGVPEHGPLLAQMVSEYLQALGIGLVGGRVPRKGQKIVEME